MQQRKEGEMKCSLNHHHKVKKCGPLWRQVRSYRAKKYRSSVPVAIESLRVRLAVPRFDLPNCAQHRMTLFTVVDYIKWSGILLIFISKITFMCYDFISFIRVSKGPYLGTNKCKWESEQEEKGDDRLGYGASHSAQSFCTANTVIAHISLARGVMLFFFFLIFWLGSPSPGQAALNFFSWELASPTATLPFTL